MTRPVAAGLAALLGAASALGYAAILWWSWAPAPEVQLALLCGPLAAAWIAAGAVVGRCPGLPVAPILAVAVLLRGIAAVPAPALSSDIYRYAWDARVQRSGESPYAYAPVDDALAELRDEAVHPHINRPLEHTVYPPGGQAVFRVLPDDIDAIRWIFIGVDLCTMLLLVRLLRVNHADPARVIWYAWCPLVVLELGNNGHLEAVVLPLLVAVALANRAGAHGRSGVLLGMAAAIKLYPVLAAAALLARRPPRRWVRVLGPAAAVVGLLYVAYGLRAGSGVLGFLPRYFRSYEDHNIGIRAAVHALLEPVAPHPREVAMAVCAALLGAGLLWIGRQRASIELQLQRVAGLYVLTLATALHPWYALWIAPWLCFHPRPAWLWLLATLPLSYLKYATADGVMPGWIVPVEIVPTVLLLGAEARRFPNAEGDAPPCQASANAESVAPPRTMEGYPRPGLDADRQS